MTDLRQAAQQALEALEGWEHCDKWVWPVTALEQAKRNTTESLAALRTALAMHQVSEFAQAQEQQQAEPVAKLFGSLPVYDTTPPQRQWVGLTDEEIHRTTVLLGFNPEWKTEIGVAHAIVRNLEAKLKERNND
jgi:hypothetical protein